MSERQHVALTTCFFCGEGNEILLAARYDRSGRPVQDLAPFHGRVCTMNPCQKCEELMTQGIILLSIDDEKSDPDWNKPPPSEHTYVQGRGWVEEQAAWMPNPYRTGGFFVLREEAVRRIFTGEPLDFALKHRWCFIEHRAAELLGLFAQHEEAANGSHT